MSSCRGRGDGGASGVTGGGGFNRVAGLKPSGDSFDKQQTKGPGADSENLPMFGSRTVPDNSFKPNAAKSGVSIQNGQYTDSA